MTTMFLIRHGELFNPNNIIYDGTPHLTEFGRKKMRLLGKILRDMDETPDAFVSSDYTRAMQSSEEIMRNYPDLRIQIEPDPRLRDPVSPDLYGRRLEWLAKIVDPYTYPELLVCTGIERPPSFTARMVEVIKEVVQRYQGKTIFILSHGDPTAFAMWRLLNPQKPLLTLRELKAEVGRVVYLEKGEAWRIELDDVMNVVNHTHIPNPMNSK